MGCLVCLNIMIDRNSTSLRFSQKSAFFCFENFIYLVENKNVPAEIHNRKRMCISCKIGNLKNHFSGDSHHTYLADVKQKICNF